MLKMCSDLYNLHKNRFQYETQQNVQIDAKRGQKTGRKQLNVVVNYGHLSR